MIAFAISVLLQVQPGILGVKLHDDISIVRRSLPTSREVPVRDIPGLVMVRDERLLVTLCNGVVNEVQEPLGAELHAFAATVKDAEALYGQGEYRIYNSRTSSGEYSWIDVRWTVQGSVYRIGYNQLADGEISVFRSWMDVSLCSYR